MKSIISFALVLSISVLSITTVERPRTSQSFDRGIVVDDVDPIDWPVDKFIKTTKTNLDRVFKNVLPFMLEMSSGLSPECMKSFVAFGNALRRFKDWPFKMLDASSKLHSGMLVGTTYGFGSYDECVDIVVEDQKTSRETFRGQYCLVAMKPPSSMMKSLDIVANESGIKDFESTMFKIFPQGSGVSDVVTLGSAICLPSSCSADDIENVFRKGLLPMGFTPSVVSCYVKAPPKVNTIQIVVCCMLAPLVILTVIGTMFDALSTKYGELKINAEGSWKKTAFRVLKEFSMYSNTKKFLRGPSYGGKLEMLAGMRFLSITWVIVGHSFVFPEFWHFILFKDLSNMFGQHDIPFTAILNMSLSMDTFFAISGFLIFYTSWKTMEKENGKLPPFHFFMKRILRLIPTQFLVIGILMLMPLFGDGPLWTPTWKPKVEGCQKHWWKNLLFIQNFGHIYDNCLFHSWYIAASMQLHIIAFFLLILLYKKPGFGIFMNVGLSVASCLAISLVTYFKGYPPAYDPDLRATTANIGYVHNVYGQVYGHIAPYCIGVLLAYCLIKYPDVKRFRGNWRVVGWMFATATALAALYGVYPLLGYAWFYQHPFLCVFYAGTHRAAWTLSIAWVIHDCVSHPEGIVNSILSWKPFVHLDSLALLVYLVHPLVMAYHQARAREHVNSDHIDMIYYCIGNIVLTYMVAFLLHITVECPINSLNAALLKKPKSQKLDLECQVKNVS